jgi:hypothetical protein
MFRTGGKAVATIQTMDGGRVESRAENNRLYVQKYDASGAKVGNEIDVVAYIGGQVEPLSNGGFIVTGGAALRGYYYTVHVYDSQANKVAAVTPPGTGYGLDVAASPDGGFLVASRASDFYEGRGSAGAQYEWQPILTLYDNAGAQTKAPVYIAGELPEVTAQANGDYLVQWQDGDIGHNLVIDPANPPALAKPGVPNAVIYDNDGPDTGVVTDSTTDTTPVVRVAVEKTGAVVVNATPNSNADEESISGGVAVTEADVARGYIDVPLTFNSPPIAGPMYTVFTRFKSSDGVVSDRDRDTFYFDRSIQPGDPDSGGRVITSPGPGSTVTGGSGNDTIVASQGADVLTGGAGADAFTFKALPWSAGRITDFAVGADRLDLSAIFQSSGYAGSDPIADGRMSLDSDGAGGTRVFFDRDAPNAGDWPFHITTLQGVAPTGLTWAQLSQGGSPPSTPPTSGEGQVITSPGPGSTVNGGTGNDTIIASQGADVLTGAGGGDAFTYKALPWSAGRITDFAVGTDRLDLSAIFQSSGYTGSDPIGDGRMTLQSDGSGGTKVFFDRDAPNAGDWPFHITTLQGVSPAGLTWAKLSGGASNPPPSSGPTVGFTASSSTVIEGNSGFHTVSVATVTRSSGEGQATVEWTLAPSGANPVDAADFMGASRPGSGVVTFAAGETTKSIAFTLNGDTTAEPDETFTLTLSNPQNASLGASSLVVTLKNDDNAQPPPSDNGQVLTSDQYGDTLIGGAGADTLIAGQGPDQLTGAGGADHFVFKNLVWNAGVVTDFTPGQDKVDLSALFDAWPNGVLETRLSGNSTQIYFDQDGAGGEWPIRLTTLNNVTPGQLGADWLIS